MWAPLLHIHSVFLDDRIFFFFFCLLMPHEKLRLALVTQRRDQIARKASNYKHVVYFPGFVSSDFLFIYMKQETSALKTC